MGKTEKTTTALLTINGLDEMKKPQIKKIKKWLLLVAEVLDKEKYSKVTRFRLQK